MRLVRVPRIATEPLALARREELAIAAYDGARFGLNTEPAAVLDRIIMGKVGQAERGPNEPRVLGGLLRYGIVQDDGRGGFAVHADVAYSLGCPSAPAAPAPAGRPDGARRRYT